MSDRSKVGIEKKETAISSCIENSVWSKDPVDRLLEQFDYFVDFKFSGKIASIGLIKQCIGANLS